MLFQLYFVADGAHRSGRWVELVLRVYLGRARSRQGIILTQGRVAIRPDHLLNSVVKWLEERLRHLDDGGRDNLFLLSLQEFLLLMGLDLDTLEVGFASSLPQHALIFTAWPVGQVPHWRIILRHGRDGLLLVVLDLEVEHLKRIKDVKVVEVGRWVSLNLLEERCNIGFILER